MFHATRAADGQRAQLSAKYAYNREIQLRRFAATFPNTAVCDLSREHLDAFFGSQAEFSAKSRNHYRGAVRQFCNGQSARIICPQRTALSEADAMRPERGNTAEILFYSPEGIRALLEGADGSMRGAPRHWRTWPDSAPLNCLRITWGRRVARAGPYRITARNSKTRQRRLVESGGALRVA